MASKTGTLRRQLGPVKYHLRNRITAADNFMSEDVPTVPDEIDQKLEEWASIDENLRSTYRSFREKHDAWVAILDAIEDKDVQETEFVHYDAVCEEYMDVLIEAERALQQLDRHKHKLERQNLNNVNLPVDEHVDVNVPANPQPDPNPLFPFGQSLPPVVQSNRNTAVKIPKMVLPRYDGNYLDWDQFWGIFEANIHNRTDLTNIEKLTFLVGQLDGTAKQSIGGIRITDDNYDAAVCLLKRRFSRAEKFIVTMLYTELRRLQPADRKITSKQKVFDECERIFRQLASAGEDIENNHLLVVDLMSKFPADMIQELQSRYEVDADSSLCTVRSAMEKLISRQEASLGLIDDLQLLKNMSCSSGNKNRHNQGEQSFQDDGRSAVSSALPAVNQAQGSRNVARGPQMLTPPGGCYFCEGSHFNGECTVYATAKSRIERLKTVGRCPRCMKRHPRGPQGNRNCPGVIKCVHCKSNGSHVSALCFQHFPETAAVSPVFQPDTNSRTQVTPPGPTASHSVDFTGGRFDTNSTNQLQAPTHGGITALNNDCKPALFQTAKAVIVNPRNGKQQIVRLAFDTMSSRSYIRDSISRVLGLCSPNSENLLVSVFGTRRTLEVPTSRVSFNVILRDGSAKEVTANTTKVICNSSALPNGWTNEERDVLSEYREYLADDPFDDNGTIDVLIGANLVWQFIDGPSIRTQAPHLAFIPSKFGLLLAGESEHDGVDRTEPTMLCITESPCQFPSELGLVTSSYKLETDSPDVDEFWDLEKIGIQDDPTEDDDDIALDAFQKSVTFDGERYNVRWPWIEEKKVLLPSNYETAYDRFRSLVKRLHKQPELLQSYKDILQLQIDRQIIEEVPENELVTENTVHYLPHHPVVKPGSATTRIRIVYDAASKSDHVYPSLNECLMRGPVILPDLCKLLMRMRTGKTVVISDIEKAFLQVGLQVNERDVTRFLWFKDDTKLDLSNNIKVFRFCRVNFGVVSSPFLLAATIDHHLSKEGTEFAEALRQDIYVDNVISVLSPDQSPIEYYTTLKQLFARAGMNIQEFYSNSQQLLEFLPKNDHVRNPNVKVLGLRWEALKDDTFRVALSSKFRELSCEPVTKRNILQSIASVFDPLGFFQPALLSAKLMLKRLWELRYKWDDPVDAATRTDWLELKQSLLHIFEHRIPRFIGTPGSDSSLAVFSDASEKAYATAIYLRVPFKDGKWKVNLLFAKSRLAPTSKKNTRLLTLPRLELMGLAVAARAARFCRDGLNVPDLKIDFFVDSECVLHWLRHCGFLKRFVLRRVEDIKKTVHCEYHYVSTEDNPADCSTRGMESQDLLTCEKWWSGPDWLSLDPTFWPRKNLDPVSDSRLREFQAELKPAFITATLTVTEDRNDELPGHFLSINPDHVSTLMRLIRVSVVVLKFLKKRVWQRLSAETQESHSGLNALFRRISEDNSIVSQDYVTAKISWVKSVQMHHFEQIFTELENGGKKTSSMISQLNLGVDEDGLIRTYGRMLNADLEESARAPLLLPKNDRFTTLVIVDVHERIFHSGVSHTLSEVRQNFWVLHGRSVVRRILRKCLICRHYKTARPFRLPPMPPLPVERVRPSTPFKFIGLDYFGPVTVKVNDSNVKMWVCLFTCLVVRAVHLEPVMNCSAAEFLNCFIRFVSRRGVPSQVICDNAAQFRLVKILGNQAWKRTPRDDAILSYSASRGVSWKFITELAPWQGGFYERLVGVVKSALRTSIRRKLLSWTDFVTLIVESEAIVNSRPITFVGDDSESRFRVLRPCDFLIESPTSLTDSPDGSNVTAKCFGEAGKRLVSIWKQHCRTLQRLWSYWYDEYLLSLRETNKALHKSRRSDVCSTPRLSQIVLVQDSDAPRGHWKLARIVNLTHGNDGKVRSAEIELSNGVRLRRAINHLIPLEIEDSSDDSTTRSQRPHVPELNQSASSSDADRGKDAFPHPDPETNPDDDEPFWGFSQSDVQRVEEALRRFDVESNDEF